MLGGYISKINIACQKRKALFFLLLTLVLITLIWGISRLNISENIFSTLPEGESFEPLNALLESKNLSNKVVFSIQAGNIENDDLVEIIEQFADTLQKSASSYLSDIEGIRPDIDEVTYDYFYQNFPFLIPSSYYDYIDSKIIEDSIIASLQNALIQLTSPGGAFMKNYILNDPLFISSPFFQNLNADFSNAHYTVEDGLLFSKDKKKRFCNCENPIPPK